MLDSESQLREAIQKMREPKQSGAPGSAESTNVMAGMEAIRGTSHETMPGMAPAAASASVKYICPMPEHVSIEYDHPGKCPICGMTLVPVSPSTLQKLQPGGKLLYYTCPMPEHSDVRSDKPGKCPKCGMTLIPVMEAPPVRGAAANQPASSAKAEGLPTLYTCPMASHADVVSDRPGDCPKCGAKLVKTSEVAHGKVAEEHLRKQQPSVSQPAEPMARQN